MLAPYVHAEATPTHPSPIVRAACRFLTPFKLCAIAVSNQIHVPPRTTNMLLWFLSMLASYVHAGAAPTHPSPIVKMMPQFFSFGAFCLFSLLFAYLSSFRASNDDWRARPGHS